MGIKTCSKSEITGGFGLYDLCCELPYPIDYI
jgi:hypothetical protein